ncbi:hypothetical protein ABEB36_014375 [Hypothenemus hampei]|uniref:Uncharacterized protein n=1 Tax=Hypothenemus hampei TaxID=57062 RepID=A0ABD1E573_HYPHA
MSRSYRKSLTNEVFEQVLLESDDDELCYYDEENISSEQPIMEVDSDGEEKLVEDVPDNYECANPKYPIMIELNKVPRAIDDHQYRRSTQSSKKLCGMRKE